MRSKTICSLYCIKVWLCVCICVSASHKSSVQYDVKIFRLFWGAHHLAPKWITPSLILNYQRPALARLVSCPFFLTYNIPSAFCIWAFPFSSVNLTLYFMNCCVAGWLAPNVLLLLQVLLPILSPSFLLLYIFPLPDSPPYPFSCLTTGNSEFY